MSGYNYWTIDQGTFKWGQTVQQIIYESKNRNLR